MDAVDDRLRRAVVHGQDVTVTRYAFAPGGRFPHHRHEQEQVTFVIDGEITFLVEGRPYTVSTDEVIILPSGIPHSAEAGAEGAQVISVVTPRRADEGAVEVLEGD
jgi:quercetin dioxygenase-like cupin family protein